MIRWTDLIGLAGFATVLLALQLLFPDSAENMNWRYWLGGLALWLVGFASVVGWVILRWSVRQSRRAPPPLLLWSVRRAQEMEVTSKNEERLPPNEKSAESGAPLPEFIRNYQRH